MDEVRRLIGLAWPVVLGQVGLLLMGVVDLLMVRSLGEDATAAVGIAITWSFASLVFGMGLASGIDPLVAQAYGAGDPRRAGTAAARGGVVLLLACVPIMGLHLVAEPVFRFLRQPPTAIEDAATFCRILAVSVPAFLGFAFLRQWLQGGGAMRPAMWVVALGNVVNLVCAWVLVNGWGPVPTFGVPGVAWATTIVRWVMLFALVWLGRHVLWEARPLPGWLDWTQIGRVALVTLGVGMQIGLEVWAFNAGSLFAGALGATEAAAHTAALNAASLAFMVPLGISAAAATRVGNLVGAGQDWRRAGWTAVAMGAGAMTFSAILFLLVPEKVGATYNTDPDVIALVATILPLAAMFQWFDGTQVVAFGVLRGLGDTRRPGLFNLLGYWLVGLPLGAWLAFGAGWGLPGVWLAYVIGLVTVALLLVWRLAFHSRRGLRPVPLQ
jgi:MATE family multidrug resistance protein